MCKASFAHSRLASNPFVQGMVWQLRVKCLQHELGCAWTDLLGTDGRNLKKHDAACPFKAVKCSLCGLEVKRANCMTHASACKHRQFRIDLTASPFLRCEA
jgi:hypothetical protein